MLSMERLIQTMADLRQDSLGLPGCSSTRCRPAHSPCLCYRTRSRSPTLWGYEPTSGEPSPSLRIIGTRIHRLNHTTAPRLLVYNLLTSLPGDREDQSATD